MSARETLRREMTHQHLYMTDECADELIDAALREHAHELAEQQRAWANEPLTDAGAPEYGSVENVLEAADRIDPYLNGEGPGRPGEEPTA